jgi:LacI family transcriptional regulator/LacI family repressor for deo operon, udp, cdd, tsx, nupC, and nupG
MAGPVTQKEIARSLGLHPSTICLALKKDPRVPRATLEVVLATARKLGYVRDPMLGALSAYRNARRQMAFHGTLAWLVSTSPDYDWRDIKDYTDYFEGASQRGSELGYKLEIFELQNYVENPARLLGIFRARNIRGVIVCPQPKVETVLNMSFENLCGITLGYTLKSPALHSVTAYHYASVREICARMRALGYQRIGYIVPRGHDRRLNGAGISAFLFEQLEMNPRDCIPPFNESSPASPASSLRSWLRKYRPDGLIAASYQMESLTKTLKLSIPEKIGVALFAVTQGFHGFCGIDESSVRIGTTAAELVISMVEHSEFGVPLHPKRILVQGRWHEGSSLRPIGAAAKSAAKRNLAGSDSSVA